MGKASKNMSELEHGDRLYYINPKDLKSIDELVIRSVTPFEPKKGHVTIEYYKSSAAMGMVTQENLELLDTLKIICPGNSPTILTMTNPPMIYHTNKKELIKFMSTQV